MEEIKHSGLYESYPQEQKDMVDAILAYIGEHLSYAEARKMLSTTSAELFIRKRDTL